MNTQNESEGDARRLSRRRRLAAYILAVAALIVAGAAEIERSGPSIAEAPPAAAAPKAPAAAPLVAAARLHKARMLTLPPAQDSSPRDHLKDAVGDFRLLQPGDDKRQPNTTVVSAPGEKPKRSWKGFYVGLNLGGAAGVSSLRTSVANPGDYFLPPDVSQLGDLGPAQSSAAGFVGGVQLGFDCHHGPLLLGLEADMDTMHLSDSQRQTGAYNSSPTKTFSISQSFHTDWLATVRPRVGVTFDRLMVYGTGGVALTRFKYDEEFQDTFNPALASASLSQTRLGWTAGGGAEFLLREHWSIKGEYLYADFGRFSTTSMLTAPAGKLDRFDHSATFNVHLVRLGLNYRF